MPHTNQLEDNSDDPDFVYDELAFSFPEQYGELPRAHPAPWGMFDKARQVPKSMIPSTCCCI